MKQYTDHVQYILSTVLSSSLMTQYTGLKAYSSITNELICNFLEALLVVHRSIIISNPNHAHIPA